MGVRVGGGPDMLIHKKEFLLKVMSNFTQSTLNNNVKYAGGKNIHHLMYSYFDGTETVISHRQCIYEVKAWFYSHWLLRYPPKSVQLTLH